MNLRDLIDNETKRSEEDKKRFTEHDGDLCMLCHAYGADKRSLIIRCFYAIHEVVPEAIDLSLVEGDLNRQGYYVRICKHCRSELLGHLQEWRNTMVARREMMKDHDGNNWDYDWVEGAIPVRVNGAVVMMTEDEYHRWREKQK